jgi:biopolymer transport protein ExbD
MAINIPSSGNGEDQAITNINTTPLVDVMLVLMIIFLITIPVVNYSVPVDLPKERNQMLESKPEDIVISVDRIVRIYWNDNMIKDDATLGIRLKQLKVQTSQPEVHIRGDINSSFEPVGKILYAVQQAGIIKVGFITEPPVN